MKKPPLFRIPVLIVLALLTILVLLCGCASNKASFWRAMGTVLSGASGTIPTAVNSYQIQQLQTQQLQYNIK